MAAEIVSASQCPRCGIAVAPEVSLEAEDCVCEACRQLELAVPHFHVLAGDPLTADSELSTLSFEFRRHPFQRWSVVMALVAGPAEELTAPELDRAVGSAIAAARPWLRSLRVQASIDSLATVHRARAFRSAKLRIPR